jgi:hypothetical protein
MGADMDASRGEPTVSSSCSRSRPPPIWIPFGVSVDVATNVTDVVAFVTDVVTVVTDVVAVVVLVIGVISLLVAAVVVLSDGELVLDIDIPDAFGITFVVAIAVGDRIVGMAMTADASID